LADISEQNEFADWSSTGITGINKKIGRHPKPLCDRQPNPNPNDKPKGQNQ